MFRGEIGEFIQSLFSPDIELNGTVEINPELGAFYQAKEVASDVIDFYQSKGIDPGYTRSDLFGAMSRKLGKEGNYKGNVRGLGELPVPREYADSINLD